MEEWCIPKKQDADFVAAMEDVLSVYSRPYDEKRPLVCMDEKPYQLLDCSCAPIPMGKGNHVRKEDCEYERKGVCSIFMFTEPLKGWRESHAMPQRRCEDWAEQMKWLIDEVYSDVDKIVLVMDNLNTHKIGSFYKRYEPQEARRLIDKLEIHYTPKHGSWLNMAEIELSVLSKQCLGKRKIPTMELLINEMMAWSIDRNIAEKNILWQFTVDDARIELAHLYPIVNYK